MESSARGARGRGTAPSNTSAVKPGPAPTTPTADQPAAPIPATSPENVDGPCHVSQASPSPTTAKSVDKSSPDQSQNPLQDQRDSINLTPLGKSTKTKNREAGAQEGTSHRGPQSVPGLKNLLPSMSNTQKSALNKLARNLVLRIPGSNTPLYKRLSDVRRQTGSPQ
ncbi:hypothetical protein LAZ67_16002211 [Cordylochernes scorpioides]|uniref:Uncharacterized protein n=1 Tax=Cordylochernes scorpioides TaxID=51811 RepID=A0ABY6LBT3_9ARAC|nr:hypothetical protein LAZ67_16002211 [Cordylochernes scorpioides]